MSSHLIESVAVVLIFGLMALAIWNFMNPPKE